MTQYVGATGDAEYRDTALSVWEDFTPHQMYIHGGGGTQSSKIEGYRKNPACVLPGDAYCESCSVWANFQWAHSLFRLTGRAAHIDTAGRMLCNAFYASLSLKGDSTFYKNVAQTDVAALRTSTLATSCCPPNIVKLFATVGGYFYSTSRDTIFVKHYGASAAMLPLGQGVKLIQKTHYPWEERIDISVDPRAPATFSLRLRAPAWADVRVLRVNGEALAGPVVDGWITVACRWQPGDTVEVEFPMVVRRITMPPRFKEYQNQAALQRGPIIYCLEEHDLEVELARDPSLVGELGGLATLYLPDEANFLAEHRGDLLGGRHGFAR